MHSCIHLCMHLTNTFYHRLCSKCWGPRGEYEASTDDKEFRVYIIPLGPGVAQGTWVNQHLGLWLRDCLTPDSLLFCPLLQEMASQLLVGTSVVLLSHFPMPFLVSVPTNAPWSISSPGSAVAFDLISLLPALLSAHFFSNCSLPERSYANADLKPSLPFVKTSPWPLSAFRRDEAQTLSSAWEALCDLHPLGFSSPISRHFPIAHCPSP